jgi:hypothetical protein
MAMFVLFHFPVQGGTSVKLIHIVFAFILTIPMPVFAQEQLGDGTVASSAPVTAPDTPPDPAPAASPSPPEPLTPGQKVERRTLRLVEPVTLFTSAFSAGLSQLRNEPEQWGQGAEGYARRFASAEGYTAAHNGIALGFDLAFHLDPRYRRMADAGFVPRLRNAVRQTFIANKDSGGTMINVSELAGNFGAGMIANTWEPAGHNSLGDGLSRGAMGLVYHTLKNVSREFLPDLLHPGH